MIAEALNKPAKAALGVIAGAVVCFSAGFAVNAVVSPKAAASTPPELVAKVDALTAEVAAARADLKAYAARTGDLELWRARVLAVEEERARAATYQQPATYQQRGR